MQRVFPRHANVWYDPAYAYVRTANAWEKVRRVWVRNANAWSLVCGWTGQLVPNGSVNTSGTWSAVGAPTLHEAVDEATPNDATDYIYHSNIEIPCAQGSASHSVRLALPGVGGPVSGDETISLRLRSQRVEFYQGGTAPTYNVEVILRDGSGNFVLSTSYTPGLTWGTATVPLDNQALANVQNWSGFTVDINPSGCVSLEGDFVRGEFSWVALVFEI